MTNPLLDLDACKRHVDEVVRPSWRGRVARVSGVIVEASGIPAAIGDLCRIDRGHHGPIEAEVVGFEGASTLLMPHGNLEGIAPRQFVTATGRPFEMAVGEELRGRVLDGFGVPLDGGPAFGSRMARRAVRSDAPKPLQRHPIRERLQTGVRALDGMLTMGRGQRLGIFSGAGVGKSTLLGQITRGTDADLTIVALVGERGREVRGFLEEVIGDDREQSITIVATSDRPPIERYLAPFVATTAAEYFRDRGLNVLLVMDSVTRFAGAAREIGLAAGEPPTVRGFPPSFFATVPKLVERLGNSEQGSITGLFTILLEGDDPHEPVADTLRGLLDGHVLLSRELADRGHFPAVDVLASLSRLMNDIVDPEHLALAGSLREVLSHWREGRDLVEIGAYKPGTNPHLDRAVQLVPRIEAVLCQNMDELSSYEETLALLRAVVGAPGA